MKCIRPLPWKRCIFTCFVALVLASDCFVSHAESDLTAASPTTAAWQTSVSGTVEIASRAISLTILHTNDTHSHFLPGNVPDFGKDVGGIARRQAYISMVRSKQPAVLVLDGGDIFQGSPFYSFFKGEVDVAAFSMCGYDATVLGNHDIDDGLANTLKQYEKATYSLLCANVVRKSDGQPVFPTHRILVRGGWKIGLIGCIGEQAFDVIAMEKRRDLTLVDPVEAVKKLAAELAPKVDFVILLSHCGFERDIELANAIPDLDVIVGGHTNTFVEHPKLVKSKPMLVRNHSDNGLGGTLVVQAFKWGVFVGHVDLSLTPEGRIATWSGGLTTMNASITVDPTAPIVRLIDAFNERIKLQTSQIVGRITGEMAYPENTKHIKDLPLGRFVCEAMMAFTGADIAIINSGAIRERLAEGPITMGQLFNSFPFENTVVTMKIKGCDIAEMMSYIASNSGKITGYQYGGIAGVLDVVEKHVRDITIGGKPLDPEHVYRLVTISYLSDGNQNGTILFKAGSDKTDTGFLMRDSVYDYLRLHETITPPKPDQLIFVGR
ncbi:MAG: bifunctional metallophosphatase/5'-nucleotidase [Candidatus Riflebacteria bacterium]|nr:bifunctional metallophosphatase/5'-nucleotidase [Candidatus Riflebacteria bacterium]